MSDVGGSADPKGVVVDGRYRLLEHLGTGVAGTVWRAREESTGHEVAVKQLRLPEEPDDESRGRAAHRLAHEARAAARVEHPSAVAVHDVVTEADDQPPWIVMELVPGESLREALRRGPLGPAEAARVGLAVLGALRAAHSVGIVHRDVKPANVLLGPHGRVVLTDFGIAHDHIAHDHAEQSVTGSTESAGSPEYVAPERVSGTNAGPASDLWSLGALLHTAVDGQPNAGPLRELISGLLARKPEDRPTAEEAARVLREVSGGAETAAMEGSGAETAVPEASGAETAVPEGSGLLEEPAATAVPDKAPADPPPPPAPRSRRRTLLRLAVGPAGILLAGGIWLGTSVADGATGGQGGWVAHREDNTDAVLHLPRQYHWMYLTGEAGDSLRFNIYGDGVIQIRLTQYEKAPASPLAEARDTAPGWEGHERSAGRYTRTAFHGAEAALSDVTYDPRGRPTRVLQLIVRTGDDRMYQLRVDMPEGTPDEKRGAALFEGARARLEIGRK